MPQQTDHLPNTVQANRETDLLEFYNSLEEEPIIEPETPVKDEPTPSDGYTDLSSFIEQLNQTPEEQADGQQPIQVDQGMEWPDVGQMAMDVGAGARDMAGQGLSMVGHGLKAGGLGLFHTAVAVTSVGQSLPIGFVEAVRDRDFGKFIEAAKSGRSASDIGRDVGLIGGESTWYGRGLGLATGLAMDVMLDPLTYLTFGGAGAIKVVGRGGHIIETLLKGAAKIGKYADEGKEISRLSRGIKALDDGRFQYTLSALGQKEVIKKSMQEGWDIKRAGEWVANQIDNGNTKLLHTGGWRFFLPAGFTGKGWTTKLTDKGWEDAGIGRALNPWLRGIARPGKRLDPGKFLGASDALPAGKGYFGKGLLQTFPGTLFRTQDETVGLSRQLRQTRTDPSQGIPSAEELDFLQESFYGQGIHNAVDGLRNLVMPQIEGITEGLLRRNQIWADSAKTLLSAEKDPNIGGARLLNLSPLRDHHGKLNIPGVASDALNTMIKRFKGEQVKYKGQQLELNVKFQNLLDGESRRISANSEGEISVEHARDMLSQHILEYTDISLNPKVGTDLLDLDVRLTKQLQEIDRGYRKAGDNLQNLMRQRQDVRHHLNDNKLTQTYLEKEELADMIEANRHLEVELRADQAISDDLAQAQKMLDEESARYQGIVDEVEKLEGMLKDDPNLPDGMELSSVYFQKQLETQVGEWGDLTDDRVLDIDFDRGVEFDWLGQSDEALGETPSLTGAEGMTGLTDRLVAHTVSQFVDSIRAANVVNQPLFRNLNVAPHILSPKAAKYLKSALKGTKFQTGMSKVFRDYLGPMSIRQINRELKANYLPESMAATYSSKLKERLGIVEDAVDTSQVEEWDIGRADKYLKEAENAVRQLNTDPSQTGLLSNEAVTYLVNYKGSINRAIKAGKIGTNDMRTLAKELVSLQGDYHTGKVKFDQLFTEDIALISAMNAQQTSKARGFGEMMAAVTRNFGRKANEVDALQQEHLDITSTKAPPPDVGQAGFTNVPMMGAIAGGGLGSLAADEDDTVGQRIGRIAIGAVAGGGLGYGVGKVLDSNLPRLGGEEGFVDIGSDKGVYDTGIEVDYVGGGSPEADAIRMGMGTVPKEGTSRRVRHHAGLGTGTTDLDPRMGVGEHGLTLNVAQHEAYFDPHQMQMADGRTLIDTYFQDVLGWDNHFNLSPGVNSRTLPNTSDNYITSSYQNGVMNRGNPAEGLFTDQPKAQQQTSITESLTEQGGRNYIELDQQGQPIQQAQHTRAWHDDLEPGEMLQLPEDLDDPELTGGGKKGGVAPDQRDRVIITEDPSTLKRGVGGKYRPEETASIRESDASVWGQKWPAPVTIQSGKIADPKGLPEYEDDLAYFKAGIEDEAVASELSGFMDGEQLLSGIDGPDGAASPLFREIFNHAVPKRVHDLLGKLGTEEGKEYAFWVHSMWNAFKSNQEQLIRSYYAHPQYWSYGRANIDSHYPGYYSHQLDGERIAEEAERYYAPGTDELLVEARDITPHLPSLNEQQMYRSYLDLHHQFWSQPENAKQLEKWRLEGYRLTGDVHNYASTRIYNTRNDVRGLTGYAPWKGTMSGESPSLPGENLLGPAHFPFEPTADDLTTEEIIFHGELIGSKPIKRKTQVYDGDSDKYLEQEITLSGQDQADLYLEWVLENKRRKMGSMSSDAMFLQVFNDTMPTLSDAPDLMKELIASVNQGVSISDPSNMVKVHRLLTVGPEAYDTLQIPGMPTEISAYLQPLFEKTYGPAILSSDKEAIKQLSVSGQVDEFLADQRAEILSQSSEQMSKVDGTYLSQREQSLEATQVKVDEGKLPQHGMDQVVEIRTNIETDGGAAITQAVNNARHMGTVNKKLQVVVTHEASAFDQANSTIDREHLERLVQEGTVQEHKLDLSLDKIEARKTDLGDTSEDSGKPVGVKPKDWDEESALEEMGSDESGVRPSPLGRPLEVKERSHLAEVTTGTDPDPGTSGHLKAGEFQDQGFVKYSDAHEDDQYAHRMQRQTSDNVTKSDAVIIIRDTRLKDSDKPSYVENAAKDTGKPFLIINETDYLGSQLEGLSGLKLRQRAFAITDWIKEKGASKIYIADDTRQSGQGMYEPLERLFHHAFTGDTNPVVHHRWARHNSVAEAHRFDINSQLDDLGINPMGWDTRSKASNTKIPSSAFLPAGTYDIGGRTITLSKATALDAVYNLYWKGWAGDEGVWSAMNEKGLFGQDQIIMDGDIKTMITELENGGGSYHPFNTSPQEITAKRSELSRLEKELEGVNQEIGAIRKSTSATPKMFDFVYLTDLKDLSVRRDGLAESIKRARTEALEVPDLPNDLRRQAYNDIWHIYLKDNPDIVEALQDRLGTSKILTDQYVQGATKRDANVTPAAAIASYLNGLDISKRSWAPFELDDQPIKDVVRVSYDQAYGPSEEVTSVINNWEKHQRDMRIAAAGIFNRQENEAYRYYIQERTRLMKRIASQDEGDYRRRRNIGLLSKLEANRPMFMDGRELAMQGEPLPDTRVSELRTAIDELTADDSPYRVREVNGEYKPVKLTSVIDYYHQANRATPSTQRAGLKAALNFYHGQILQIPEARRAGNEQLTADIQVLVNALDHNLLGYRKMDYSLAAMSKIMEILADIGGPEAAKALTDSFDLAKVKGNVSSRYPWMIPIRADMLPVGKKLTLEGGGDIERVRSQRVIPKVMPAKPKTQRLSDSLEGSRKAFKGKQLAARATTLDLDSDLGRAITGAGWKEKIIELEAGHDLTEADIVNFQNQLQQLEQFVSNADISDTNLYGKWDLAMEESRQLSVRDKPKSDPSMEQMREAREDEAGIFLQQIKDRPAQTNPLAFRDAGNRTFEAKVSGPAMVSERRAEMLPTGAQPEPYIYMPEETVQAIGVMNKADAQSLLLKYSNGDRAWTNRQLAKIHNNPMHQHRLQMVSDFLDRTKVNRSLDPQDYRRIELENILNEKLKAAGLGHRIDRKGGPYHMNAGGLDQTVHQMGWSMSNENRKRLSLISLLHDSRQTYLMGADNKVAPNQWNKFGAIDQIASREIDSTIPHLVDLSQEESQVGIQAWHYLESRVRAGKDEIIDGLQRLRGTGTEEQIRRADELLAQETEDIVPTPSVIDDVSQASASNQLEETSDISIKATDPEDTGSDLIKPSTVDFQSDSDYGGDIDPLSFQRSEPETGASSPWPYRAEVDQLRPAAPIDDIAARQQPQQTYGTPTAEEHFQDVASPGAAEAELGVPDRLVLNDTPSRPEPIPLERPAPTPSPIPDPEIPTGGRLADEIDIADDFSTADPAPIEDMGAVEVKRVGDEVWAPIRVGGKTPQMFTRDGKPLYFDPVTRRLVERMYETMDPKSGGLVKLLRGYDYIHGIWKSHTIMPFVSYHFKNVFDGMFWRNYLAGNTDPDNYAKQAMLMKMRTAKTANQRKDLSRRLGQVSGYTADELINLQLDNGIISQNFARQFIEQGDMPDDLQQLAEGADRLGVKLKQKAAGAGEKIGGGVKGFLEGQIGPVKLGFELNEWSEGLMRGSLFISRLAKGEAPEMAAQMVKAIHFDYQDLAPLERSLFKRLIPFYTFASKNVPLHLKLKFGGGHYNKFRPYSALSHNFAAEDDPAVQEHMYESLKSEVPIRVFEHKGEGGKKEYEYLLLGRLISDVDLADMTDFGRSAAFSLSPLIKSAFAAGNIYLGREAKKGDKFARVSDYPGQTTSMLGVRIDKKLEFLLGQARYLAEANRMNPFMLLGKAANTFKGEEAKLSAFKGDPMGRQQEGPGTSNDWRRYLYYFFGKNLYRLDPDKMEAIGLSRKRASLFLPPGLSEEWHRINDLLGAKKEYYRTGKELGYVKDPKLLEEKLGRMSALGEQMGKSGY